MDNNNLPGSFARVIHASTEKETDDATSESKQRLIDVLQKVTVDNTDVFVGIHVSKDGIAQMMLVGEIGDIARGAAMLMEKAVESIENVCMERCKFEKKQGDDPLDIN